MFLRSIFIQRRHAFVSIRRKSSLRLVSGVCELPHPQKRATGGEDAWFIHEKTIGVADGVGGWARKGIDSGEYSRTLMEAAQNALEHSNKHLLTPLQVLSRAHKKVECLGSSTACIVQLHGHSLRALNLGDSGFLVCRLLPSEQPEVQDELKWKVIYEAPQQCHYFNCPFQLGHEGGDMPEHGERIELSVQHGDMVVLGTDGLFDNLYPVQIASLLDSVMTSVPHEKVDTMDEVASCIAHTAHKSAKGTKNHTPFADAAKNAGYKYLGGKMDDITVITSFISGV